jgi:hypothetical protein
MRKGCDHLCLRVPSCNVATFDYYWVGIVSESSNTDEPDKIYVSRLTILERVVHVETGALPEIVLILISMGLRLRHHHGTSRPPSVPLLNNLPLL